MPTKIVVPEMGESVVEATVGRWLKKENDRINVGEAVVELETEKVDLEVGAERSGTLAHIEKQEGENVRVGDVLGVISEAGETGGAEEKARKKRGAGVEEERLDQRDQKQEGRAEQKQEHGASEEPQPAPEQKEAEREQGAGEEEPGKAAAASTLNATPSARRLAREKGVDISEIEGIKKGRVTPADVMAFLEKRESSRPFSEAAASEPIPAAGRSRREERVRMSRRRLTIARRLVEAQRTAAILTTFNDVDMSGIMNLRRRLKEAFKERHGVGLGIVSFFIKAAVAALRRFPRLNAEIQGEEMVLKHYYDIGIAVGASGGLVVPVLRDADRMSIAELEKAIKDYARKAEDGSLTMEDLRGGTFTISNGGVFGSLMSTPILNPPQAGVLGLHRIEERPVNLKGEVVVRPMMYVALSYDHRLVDGLEAVQFLAHIKMLIEDPETLLLEG